MATFPGLRPGQVQRNGHGGSTGNAGEDLGDHRPFQGFYGDRPQRPYEDLLLIPTDAGDRSSAAHHGHEHIAAARGGGPDLGATGVVINLWVGVIGELLL